MAISIHSAVEPARIVQRQVNKKNNQRDESGGKHYPGEQNQPRRVEPEPQANGFSSGLQLLMEAAMPDRKTLAELTGIAEMDAIGLQFFLAMQRQMVRLRLSGMSPHDSAAGSSTNNE